MRKRCASGSILSDCFSFSQKPCRFLTRNRSGGRFWRNLFTNSIVWRALLPNFLTYTKKMLFQLQISLFCLKKSREKELFCLYAKKNSAHNPCCRFAPRRFCFVCFFSVASTILLSVFQLAFYFFNFPFARYAFQVESSNV